MRGEDGGGRGEEEEGDRVGVYHCIIYWIGLVSLVDLYLINTCILDQNIHNLFHSTHDVILVRSHHINIYTHTLNTTNAHYHDT